MKAYSKYKYIPVCAIQRGMRWPLKNNEKKLAFILRYNWKLINIKPFTGVNDRVYEEINTVFIKLILEQTQRNMSWTNFQYR